jgi:threonine dehydrogenase-like Zn-dependent dehydrogenase
MRKGRRDTRRGIGEGAIEIDELLPDVLEGRIEPGRVFDRVTNLDGVPDGYRAMVIRPS